MKKISALESKRTGGLGKIATAKLLALERKLQEPHGRVFWFLEQLIGRIDDELERKRA